MHIQITIPRPWLTLCLVIAVGAWVGGYVDFTTPSGGVGGANNGQLVAQAQLDINRERIRQAVLEQRESILRYSVERLESEAARLQTQKSIRELNDHRSVLLAIIRERKESEELLMTSLRQLWEAEGTAYDSSPDRLPLILAWPVQPIYGTSAYFEDPEYEQIFAGLKHHAIDLPEPQGTEITAPYDGIVEKVADNGLGYSYLVLKHPSTSLGVTVETVYGHVSGFLVEEGQNVKLGDPIALTGGRPGSKGAGLLTTGPHLHFAVKVNGVLVDPLQYLPALKS